VLRLFRLGSGYIGSPSLQVTSAPNEEVIPSPPVNETVKYNCYKFSLMNDEQCKILINRSENPILLRAGQGFSTSEIDAPIYSLKIVEEGITYNWIAAV
jgi:hypothetical protein